MKKIRKITKKFNKNKIQKKKKLKYKLNRKLK